ncbi:MAG TPA: hypothetical protein VFP91_01035 [Vicinamibacterales bacterium]|nr:hypothetical protein [Vicinamibacterales bacterium]
MRHSLLAIVLLLSWIRPAAADEAVVAVANLEFHSAVWPNLHHLLYGSAWARRPKTGARRLMPDLPIRLPDTLSSDERAVWDQAVDYYDRNLASRDLLMGRGMEDINAALAVEDLGSVAVGAELRAILERAAPIYRRHFWPAHDRSNREWIRTTVERLRSIEQDMVSAQARLYGRPWFTALIRVDVVWVGRAYTSLFPTHTTVSPAEGPLVGWSAVEMVLHEVSHELILDTEKQMAEAFGDAWKEHGVLWHVVQFYLTGSALERILASRGIEYRQYLYSEGLFDRAWPQYRKPVEESWAPYVRGEITREQAILRTVAAVKR